MSLSKLFLGKHAEKLPEDNFDKEPVERSGWQHTLYVIRRDVLSMFSVGWIALMLICALFAPFISPYPDQGRSSS